MKRHAILSAMKTVFVLLVLTLAVVFYGQPAQAITFTATPLINGSFENITNFVNQGDDTMSLYSGSTAMPGWTVIGTSYAIAWIGPDNPFGLTAAQGSYFLDLTGYTNTPTYAGVEQTIKLLLRA